MATQPLGGKGFVMGTMGSSIRAPLGRRVEHPVRTIIVWASGLLCSGRVKTRIGVAGLAVAWLLAMVMAGPAAAQVPCRYEISATIAAPADPGFSSPTVALGISPNGRYVVGRFNYNAVGQNRAFVYDTTTSVFTVLPLVGGATTNTAFDVNDAGFVVGSLGGGQRSGFGFVYDIATGQYTLLPTPIPSGICSANSINQYGEVAGTRTITGPPDYQTTAFVWSPDGKGTWSAGFTDLGLIDGRSTDSTDINPSGLVGVSTGFSIDLGSIAYLWTPSSLVALGPIPGGLTSGPGDLNDRGWTLVGGLIQQNPLVLAGFIRLPSGEYFELPPLRGGSTPAILSISNSGMVAGHTNYPNQFPDRRATIWRNATPIELSTKVTTPFSGHLTSAIVNAQANVIVANGDTIDFDRVARVLIPIYGIDGDINCDNYVNVDDLLVIILNWGVCAGCDGDLNADSEVNVDDLLQVIVNWGTKGGAT